MPTQRAFPETALNLETTAGTNIRWECGRYDQVRIQAALKSGTWTTGIITVEHSIDGVTWYALDTALTFSAIGMTARIPLDGMTLLRARVSTDQAGTPGLVNLYAAFSGTTMTNLSNGEIDAPGSSS